MVSAFNSDDLFAVFSEPQEEGEEQGEAGAAPTGTEQAGPSKLAGTEQAGGALASSGKRKATAQATIPPDAVGSGVTASTDKSKKRAKRDAKESSAPAATAGSNGTQTSEDYLLKGYLQNQGCQAALQPPPRSFIPTGLLAATARQSPFRTWTPFADVRCVLLKPEGRVVRCSLIFGSLVASPRKTPLKGVPLDTPGWPPRE